jgi:putative protease
LELVAPAGNLEKLVFAIEYGADAVYFGGPVGSLRAGAGNLTIEEIHEGVTYCHARGRKAYLAVNIFAHDEDYPALRKFLGEVSGAGMDALIVSDPGVFMLVREMIPGVQIHLSTQASVTSPEAARFWYMQGVRRIIPARELSLSEIAAFRATLPEDLTLETFAHGAMCMAYSGRCLLSNYLSGRDANRGDCAQSCRWRYRPKTRQNASGIQGNDATSCRKQPYRSQTRQNASGTDAATDHVLEEEKRPGMYLPVEEDGKGTYFMSAADLCMLDRLPDLHAAGVSAIKIEGRMKSFYYVATIVRAYRAALDAMEKSRVDGQPYQFDPVWMQELLKASHRDFSTGFYDGKPTAENEAAGRHDRSMEYHRDYMFMGVVRDYSPDTGLACIEQRNRIQTGDRLELFGPPQGFTALRVDEMWDADMQPITSAPHPQQTVYIPVPPPVDRLYLLRKKT